MAFDTGTTRQQKHLNIFPTSSVLRSQSQSSHAGESPGVSSSFPGPKSGLQSILTGLKGSFSSPLSPGQTHCMLQRDVDSDYRSIFISPGLRKITLGYCCFPQPLYPSLHFPPLNTSGLMMSLSCQPHKARPSPAFTFHWMETNNLVACDCRNEVPISCWLMAQSHSQLLQVTHSQALSPQGSLLLLPRLGVKPLSDAPPTFKRAHLIRSDLPR